MDTRRSKSPLICKFQVKEVYLVLRSSPLKSIVDSLLRILQEMYILAIHDDNYTNRLLETFSRKTKVYSKFCAPNGGDKFKLM